MNLFLIIILIIFLLLLFSLIILGFIFGIKLLFYRRESFEDTYRICNEKGEIKDSYKNAKKIEYTVKSKFKNTLYGEYIKGRTNNTVLFAHGVAWSRYGMVKYIYPFIELGWNIILIDLQRHGKSEGTFPTFGYREKADIKTFIDDWYQRYPKNNKFILFGESMGAASVLQAFSLDDRVDAVIADCSFMSLRDLGYYTFKKYRINKYFARFSLFFTNLFVKLFAGFSINQINPKFEILKRPSVPIFFIHGDADDFVPTIHSIEMNSIRKNIGKSELYIAKEADHAESWLSDPEIYEYKIKEFLKTYKLI